MVTRWKVETSLDFAVDKLQHATILLPTDSNSGQITEFSSGGEKVGLNGVLLFIAVRNFSFINSFNGVYS